MSEPSGIEMELYAPGARAVAEVERIMASKGIKHPTMAHVVAIAQQITKYSLQCDRLKEDLEKERYQTEAANRIADSLGGGILEGDEIKAYLNMVEKAHGEHIGQSLRKALLNDIAKREYKVAQLSHQLYLQRRFTKDELAAIGFGIARYANLFRADARPRRNLANLKREFQKMWPRLRWNEAVRLLPALVIDSIRRAKPEQIQTKRRASRPITPKET